MNTQNNVFMITSTIDTPFGLLSFGDRYTQTLETISSIRQKDKSAIVILIDNSSQSFSDVIYQVLESRVDHFLYIGDRTPCKEFNKVGAKGAGEAYMLLVAINLIEELNISPKRIFKISGRYKLRDKFDIKFYDTQKDNYIFKTRDINEYGSISLHTRLWSACGTIVPEMKKMIQQSFYQHIIDGTTLEEAMFNIIDKTKLTEVEQIHCEGIIAPWNQTVYD